MELERFLYNINMLSDYRTIFIVKYIAENGPSDYRKIKEEYDYWLEENSFENMFKGLSRNLFTKLQADDIIEALLYDKYGLSSGATELLEILKVVDDFSNMKPKLVVSENFGYSIKPRMAKVYDILNGSLTRLDTTLTIEEAVERRKEIIFEENEKRMNECQRKITLKYDWRKL